MKGFSIMSTTEPTKPVFELRVALTTSDYERLVKFYCEGLGIEPTAEWHNDGGQALMSHGHLLYPGAIRDCRLLFVIHMSN